LAYLWSSLLCACVFSFVRFKVPFCVTRKKRENGIPDELISQQYNITIEKIGRHKFPLYSFPVVTTPTSELTTITDAPSTPRGQVTEAVRLVVCNIIFVLVLSCPYCFVQVTFICSIVKRTMPRQASCQNHLKAQLHPKGLARRACRFMNFV